ELVAHIILHDMRKLFLSRYSHSLQQHSQIAIFAIRSSRAIMPILDATIRETRFRLVPRPGFHSSRPPACPRLVLGIRRKNPRCCRRKTKGPARGPFSIICTLAEGEAPAGSTPLAAPRPVLAVAPRRTLAAELLLLRLAFLARDLLAGRLVDDLHRQAHLAAIVEAQQLDVDLLAFLDDLAHRLGPTLRQLRDVHQAVLAAEEVHERAEL